MLESGHSLDVQPIQQPLKPSIALGSCAVWLSPGSSWPTLFLLKMVSSEINQAQKDKQHDLISTWNLKKANPQKQRLEWWLQGPR
jgi:hypothetical protein